MSPLYIEVILPLRLSTTLSYKVPEELRESVVVGSLVLLKLRNKERVALVSKIEEGEAPYSGNILEIDGVVEGPPLPIESVKLIKWIAQYYICTEGEVLRAIIGGRIQNFISTKKRAKKRVPKKREEKSLEQWQLSPKQEEVYNTALKSFDEKKPLLIKGVTGSGKTLIYLSLAEITLSQNRNVLYMVPEIALSRQLRRRVERVFGDSLLVYHSGMTAAARREARELLREEGSSYIVLGTRSSIFLPFSNLGLIIIDEEHDNSYKQSEPAPRYHGRDSALVLAQLYGANVVMGSATPSLESLYNAHTGRHNLVELNERFYKSPDPSIKVINMVDERRRERVEGVFSVSSLEAMKETIELGEQVLVFRNRRSYSPMVQCLYCGDIPHCPNCNVSLNWHKRLSILKCHYCSYSRVFSTICRECANPGLKERGSGTEMIEEQLKKLFPDRVIARFDAETASSKRGSEKLLSQFEKGEIDILVGTQMITKGFDFEKLTLTVVIEADAMLAGDDFRASEKAMQLLVQLSGRGGRREKQGKIIIQSNQPTNEIYKSFSKGEDGVANELIERQDFRYPPFIRLVKLTIKHPNRDTLEGFSRDVTDALHNMGLKEFTGPVPPIVERVKREYILNYWIKLERSRDNRAIKKHLYKVVEAAISKSGTTISFSFDSDPL